MPAIRITLAASLGRSASSIFRPLVDAAKQARAQIERELAGIGAGNRAGALYRGLVTEAEKANRAMVTAAERRVRDIERAERRAMNDRQRQLTAQSREFDKAQREADRGPTLFARRASWRAARTFDSIVRGGVGLAGDMARGAGVDFNLGGMIGRAVGQERAAVALSNQGFMPGAGGANGRVQDPRKILDTARSVADTYARSTDEILQATSAFVGLTGDLAGARAIMGDLALLSNATGSNLTDMASAAASVSTALDQGFAGTAQQRMDATSDVMRAIAGQGKVGAVEIKDLAAQMAKLAAASGQFAGKREDLLAFVGVMAQESRKAGGSASATQAATSILSFATNLSKPSKAQQKMLAQYGLDPFADKGKTAVKSPEEFIKEAIYKTRGNLQALGGIFSTSGSMRAVRGFANIYNQAGGGAAGQAAVEAEIATLKRASLDRAEAERANAEVMRTAAAKAQKFQNNLERVASSMAETVLPQFEQLAPKAIEAAGALGKIVGWAAANPFQAVGAAMAVSVTRAVAESTMRAGIDKVLSQSLGNAAGAVGARTVGTALGAAGAVVAVSVVAWEAGKLLIDWLASKRAEEDNGALAADAEAGNALSAARAQVRTRGYLEESKRKTLADAEVRLGSIVDAKRGTNMSEGELALFNQQVALLESIHSVMAGIQSGGIPVTNLEKLSMAPPYAYQGGRTGPGGGGMGGGMFRPGMEPT